MLLVLFGRVQPLHAQPAPAPAAVSLRASIAAIVAAQAADAITTHVALRNPAIHEVILTQTGWKNDLILGSIAVGEIALLRRAENRKVARIAGFCFAGIHGYVAYRNIQTLRAIKGRP